MVKMDIPIGVEIKQSKLLENCITIRVPNTRFWVLGEKNKKELWDVFIIDPNTNRKEILRSNAKTSSFALFSNIILKTPFPTGKKEIEFSNIKKIILKITK
jgi:hypothetical protein